MLSDEEYRERVERVKKKVDDELNYYANRNMSVPEGGIDIGPFTYVELVVIANALFDFREKLDKKPEEEKQIPIPNSALRWS